MAKKKSLNMESNLSITPLKSSVQDLSLDIIRVLDELGDLDEFVVQESESDSDSGYGTDDAVPNDNGSNDNGSNGNGSNENEPNGNVSNGNVSNENERNGNEMNGCDNDKGDKGMKLDGLVSNQASRHRSDGQISDSSDDLADFKNATSMPTRTSLDPTTWSGDHSDNDNDNNNDNNEKKNNNNNDTTNNNDSKHDKNDKNDKNDGNNRNDNIDDKISPSLMQCGKEAKSKKDDSKNENDSKNDNKNDNKNENELSDDVDKRLNESLQNDDSLFGNKLNNSLTVDYNLNHKRKNKVNKVNKANKGNQGNQGNQERAKERRKEREMREEKEKEKEKEKEIGNKVDSILSSIESKEESKRKEDKLIEKENSFTSPGHILKQFSSSDFEKIRHKSTMTQLEDQHNEYVNLPELSGWVLKLSGKGFGVWQRRWLVVKRTHLLWSQKRQDIVDPLDPKERRKWKNSLTLLTIQEVKPINSTNERKFDIITNSKTYHFRALSRDDRDRWADGLNQHLHALAKSMTLLRQTFLFSDAS